VRGREAEDILIDVVVSSQPQSRDVDTLGSTCAGRLCNLPLLVCTCLSRSLYMLVLIPVENLSLYREYGYFEKEEVVVWYVTKLQIHNHSTYTYFIYTNV
jgi:hypothetical protein